MAAKPVARTPAPPPAPPGPDHVEVYASRVKIAKLRDGTRTWSIEATAGDGVAAALQSAEAAAIETDERLTRHYG